jgi:hypothetical protein
MARLVLGGTASGCLLYAASILAIAIFVAVSDARFGRRLDRKLASLLPAWDQKNEMVQSDSRPDHAQGAIDTRAQANSPHPSSREGAFAPIRDRSPNLRERSAMAKGVWHAFYFNGFDEAAPTRTALIEADEEEEAQKIAVSKMDGCKRVDVARPIWAKPRRPPCSPATRHGLARTSSRSA